MAMDYAAGLATLEGRARFATVVLWLFGMVGALSVFGQSLEAMGMLDIAVDVGPLALAVGLAYVAFFLLFVASVVLVAMWIHRAHANLAEAGIVGLEFTPGWAVGWYFIPFANLVKPFQAMRELWKASRGESHPFDGPAPGEVTAWWACWIIGNITSSIGDRILLMSEGDAATLTLGNALGATGTALIVVAAMMLVKLIQGVTRAQRGGVTAAGVFA
jgi:hypothetical protein